LVPGVDRLPNTKHGVSLGRRFCELTRPEVLSIRELKLTDDTQVKIYPIASPDSDARSILVTVNALTAHERTPSVLNTLVIRAGESIRAACQELPVEHPLTRAGVIFFTHLQDPEEGFVSFKPLKAL
jgi:hypothetical protein